MPLLALLSSADGFAHQNSIFGRNYSHMQFSLTASMLETIDDNKIGSILAGEGLTLVLLTSTWDGNGIILRSIISGMQQQYRSVRFCEADYEKTPQLARLFNLTSPPGLVFIREGELVHRITKPISASQISALIQAAA